MRLQNKILALFLFAFLGCQKDSGIEKDISKIEVNFRIERFDSVFSNAKPKDLPQLKKTFPFLFSKRVPDSIWVKKFSDTLQRQMFNEAKLNFGDVVVLKKDLERMFQHLKYYDKTFKIPRVITVADNVDYRSKSIVNNELVIINLLNYLGKDHEFYQNITQYFSNNMTSHQIIPDVVNGYAKMYAYQSKKKTFLEELIYFGKLLYFKDVMIPEYTDAQKIGYSQEELDWAEANESQIWSYFVENELLFNSDTKLVTRFIAPTPFSKFYLQIDNDSPGRVGQFMGWQIVRAYVERTDKNILDIMQTDADVIFNTSKYKPKK